MSSSSHACQMNMRKLRNSVYRSLDLHIGAHATKWTCPRLHACLMVVRLGRRAPDDRALHRSRPPVAAAPVGLRALVAMCSGGCTHAHVAEFPRRHMSHNKGNLWFHPYWVIRRQGEAIIFGSAPCLSFVSARFEALCVKPFLFYPI
jgi:hypothetical protein